VTFVLLTRAAFVCRCTDVVDGETVSIGEFFIDLPSAVDYPQYYDVIKKPVRAIEYGRTRPTCWNVRYKMCVNSLKC